MKILLVDNDETILTTVSESLTSAGHSVITCSSSAEAIEVAIIEKPQLILLEFAMPGIDGVELCFELSKQNRLQNTMFVFMSNHDQDYEQVAAFNAGADDYIIKPVNLRVLNKRINALLRRNKLLKPIAEKGQLKNLYINQDYYIAYVGEKETELRKKEFEILALLFTSPGKIFSRKELYEKIWLTEMNPKNRTLDVLMHNVRNKIGENYIKTISKVGYYLDISVEENK
ncbi:MAG: response regulator transcription factor [Bacteroidia bacterium]